ncbi:acetyl-CoA carboxylase, carboxyltransferase subunit beta [Sphingorhabdus sp.]|jgi:acetyl-CoA carboxylase carboxyl transferase subunit beta|uniref:acetyl-CoA carboxylase, carboxyltransferase subunit beta n=1 Tax=Sphingorhabdus sp. TaxID=1902408 RepID=UPI002BC0316D|nr:acetyl-CoA carboxylase, carboxyltransferase subunit beta [Sphingorhabdus sp.]HMT41151.1 acetyl-CoA carboxylase, carboxyltransferase subunit beta [Sphingorhabdus sp.]
MNWVTRVRNAIPFIAKRETAETLWHKCKGCNTMIFLKEYEENQSVCPKCDFHGRIGPAERFAAIFDADSFTVLPMPRVVEDPLKFKDSKKYPDRIKAARAATGEQDAMVSARGTIDGHAAVVSVQDFAFMGGSMGMAVGEAFIAAAQEALKAKCPYVIFTAAGGARMQEGILSLMQMPRTTVAIQMLREAGLPYIVVLTDPTTGGVTASYAMLGDIQIAEPGALIGFAGQRVIEQTIREKLPEGFQRAEYLLDHGMVDMVTHRHELKTTLARLVDYLTAGKKAA